MRPSSCCTAMRRTTRHRARQCSRSLLRPYPAASRRTTSVCRAASGTTRSLSGARALSTAHRAEPSRSGCPSWWRARPSFGHSVVAWAYDLSTPVRRAPCAMPLPDEVPRRSIVNILHAPFCGRCCAEALTPQPLLSNALASQDVLDVLAGIAWQALSPSYSMCMVPRCSNTLRNPWHAWLLNPNAQFLG